MPRKWTTEEWKAECTYIAEQTAIQGKSKAFNFNTEIFRQYCEMQANAADAQGFNDSAAYIRQCIDDLK